MYQIESMEEAYRKPPLRNSPRIAMFKNEAGSNSQFFITCEQITLCQVQNFRSALFEVVIKMNITLKLFFLVNSTTMMVISTISFSNYNNIRLSL